MCLKYVFFNIDSFDPAHPPFITINNFYFMKFATGNKYFFYKNNNKFYTFVVVLILFVNTSSNCFT